MDANEEIIQMMMMGAESKRRLLMSYNKFPGYIHVYEGNGGFLFIMDMPTKAAIILHHTQMKGLIKNLAKCKAIMEYEPKPATVDGMTALKHIMDGGGAYQIDGTPEKAIRLCEGVLRMPACRFATEVYFGGSRLTATDWVLVP